MAKFEIKVYDPKTGEVEKTHKRAFMPVSLYTRFQAFAEKSATPDKFTNDEAWFAELKPLVLELFPDMTEEEYDNKADLTQIIRLLGDVVNKSTDLSDEGNEKNA